MNVSCILRGSEMIIPKGRTEIAEGDKLLVVSTAAKQQRVLELLSGTDRP